MGLHKDSWLQNCGLLQRDTQSPKTGSLPGVHVDLSYSGRESVMTSYYFFFQPPILSTLCILVSPERISVPVSLCILYKPVTDTSVHWA